MENVKPRFEFRTFAQDFGMVLTKMRRLAKCEKIRESGEHYIVSAQNDENNTKIRDDLMDIKIFVKEDRGLQQWNPRMKGKFPMARQVILDEVFPAFGVEVPELSRETYTQDQYLDEVIRPHQDLRVAAVLKHRFAYTVNDCIAEHAHILINGAAIQTVAVESTDLEAILEAKKMLGLDEYQNVNYLIAIKRVLGMVPLAE